MRGLGRDFCRLRTDPGVPLSLSQAHTGPRHQSGASKDTRSDSCPGWALGLRVGVGERKAPVPHLGPRPRTPWPLHVHTPEIPADRVGEDPGEAGPARWGEGGVLTPPSCPLPPWPQPDRATPTYLHARQARLHRRVGHGARRRHFLARDARSRAASRPGAARSPRVAGRALEPEATAPRGRSQRSLAGRGPIH